MKKILIVLLLIIVITGVFVGCASGNDITESATDKPITQPTKKPTERPTKEPTQKPTEEPVDELTLEDTINAMYESATFEMARLMNTTITKENMAYYFGTDEFDFLSGIASEPMISAIPYSLCLIEVEEGADIEGIKNMIKENVNPAKWICVSVDEENVIIDNKGNIIILIMSENSQELHDSFKNLD